MIDISRKKVEIFLLVEEIMLQRIFVINFLVNYILNTQGGSRRRMERTIRYVMAHRIPKQVEHMQEMVELSDSACLDRIRMNRNAFARLCYLLEHVGGLVHSRYVGIQEKVCMFLIVLAHHTKNRIVKGDFSRSGETISKHFHAVLKAVLKLHPILLVNPKPVSEDCTNTRWKCFKGCLGALDGTYIKVKVRETEKPRYRNRKGDASVNVLGVCDQNMKFVYMLPGWEGSAADSRVLRDAISRTHGLRVPNGNYYLCDNGYANGKGFLTPYKGVRYHLKEWGHGSSSPQNYKEFFNMKHSKARNVIERTFGLLKMRWAILRSPAFYPIKIQNHIILACVLLHNFIKSEMPLDPLEHLVDELYQDNEDEEDMDFINTVESSHEWNIWRDELAENMFNEWMSIS